MTFFVKTNKKGSQMQNTNSIKNKIDIIEYLLSMAIKGKLYDFEVEALKSAIQELKNQLL